MEPHYSERTGSSRTDSNARDNDDQDYDGMQALSNENFEDNQEDLQPKGLGKTEHSISEIKNNNSMLAGDKSFYDKDNPIVKESADFNKNSRAYESLHKESEDNYYHQYQTTEGYGTHQANEDGGSGSAHYGEEQELEHESSGSRLGMRQTHAPDQNEHAINPTTHSQEIQEDKKVIQVLIDKIIDGVQASGALFEDAEFPPDHNSLYIDISNPPEYSKEGGHIIEWKRPQELSDNPKMLVDGLAPGDVSQGVLGDCWLLGSFSTLATNPDLLNNLIVFDGIEYGFAVFQFFKNGEWVQVVVDTQIPYSANNKCPLYGHCLDTNEFWVPLMEKAYAKLHGSFEAIVGGSMSEGLVDLTGGASEKFTLKETETQDNIENGNFWKMLKRYHNSGFLLGCANSTKNKDGNQEEGMGNQGILLNHAYGVLEIREIEIYNLQLLRIRNPWGQAEWTGAFSDEDEEWDKHKGLREMLNYNFKNDGTWWMSYQDWVSNFNKFYVCRIFPESWEQYSIASKWEGKTAGGPYPSQIDRDEEVSDTIKMDSNDKWFNNPQFRVTIFKSTRVFISLMQADEKITKKAYIPCNFLVVKTKNRKDRLWEVDKDDIVMKAAEGMQKFAQREITKTAILEAGADKKPAHYIIVPNIEMETKKDEKRQFWLRVFTAEHVDLVALPETLEVSFAGEWNQDTAGGKRLLDNGTENPFWCRNPQYFLNLTKDTHLKIILRKTGGFRKMKGIPVGMTITKAFSPTSAQASSKPIKTINTLINTNSAKKTMKNKTADKFMLKFEPPKLDKLERKLQILPNEWVVESTYQGEEVAAQYFYWQSTQGPFLIVPSLAKEEVTGNYSLTIYSSALVEVQKLEDSRNYVISSKWTEKTAGGCHLYDRPFETKNDKITWANNPKFSLLLNTESRSRVKITLSRPEKVWKKPIAKDTVGCMIGFYLYESGVTPSEKICIIKNNFVPMNELSEEIELEPTPNGYIVMPTTYEPHKLGPFVLSISTDVDFTIRELE